MFGKCARVISVAIIGLLVATGLAYADPSPQLTLGVFGGSSLSKIRGDDLSGSLSDINLGPLDYGVSGSILDPIFTDPSGTVQIDDVTLDPLKTRTGVSLGAFLNVPGTDVFSIQPEMHYVMKGSKQDLEFAATVDPGGLNIPLTVPGELQWQLNYIEIPILMKLTIPTQGSISPCLLAGPALAFRTSSKVKLRAVGIEESEDIKDLIKSTDLGLVLGGGVDFRMSPTTVLNVDARYNLGMSDLLDVPPIVSLFTPDLTNSAFGLRVAIGYRLGKR
jgi:Outer membrane protein beta-barrel domain